MKTIKIGTLSIFAAALLLLGALTMAVAEAPYVPGEVVLKVRQDLSLEQVQSLLTPHGCTVVESVPRLQIHVAVIPGESLVPDVVADLEADPAIEFAHPNYLGRGGDFFPDDTHFGQQWHHNNTGQGGGTADADIDAVEGWTWTRGSSDIVVAVLDTGIDSDHIEFQGRIAPGFDFVNEDANPEADHPHGPWVTGLVAANADNQFAVAGVDHFCTIMPVKVLDQNNGGTTADLIQGIDYAAANGADVISMSLINYPGTGGLQAALASAVTTSVLIACGGNNGIGNADVSWPGASEHTVAVGWTTNTDARNPSSGTGNALDLVAPGTNVVTIDPFTNLDALNFFSGCSAATPVTAGIASLCLALDPGLTHNQVRDLLIQGAEDEVGPPQEDIPGWDEYFGHGRVNLNNTIRLLTPVSVEVSSPVPMRDALSVTPNPFNRSTTIRLDLASPAEVTVAVYSVAGRRVRAFAPREVGSGEVAVTWDGYDDDGHRVAPGIYYAKAEAGAERFERKITVLQ